MLTNKKSKRNPSEEAQEISEYTLSEGVSTISENPAILHGVKILGLYSANGRSYLPEAVEKAKALYEGAKVNINHPKGNPETPRDYQDRIGNIQNVEYRPEVGLFADFQINPRHPLAEQLIWDAQHAPRNVGFSHNIQAKTALNPDGSITVKEILRVRSVDIVADPATTLGLFESQHQSNTQVIETVQADLEKLREGFQTLREQFQEIMQRSPIFHQPESREQETFFEKGKESLPDFLKKICSD